MENIEFLNIDKEFEYAEKSLKEVIDVITKEYLKLQIAYEKSKHLHLQKQLELQEKVFELQEELIDIYSENPIIDVEVY